MVVLCVSDRSVPQERVETATGDRSLQLIIESRALLCLHSILMTSEVNQGLLGGQSKAFACSIVERPQTVIRGFHDYDMIISGDSILMISEVNQGYRNLNRTPSRVQQLSDQ